MSPPGFERRTPKEMAVIPMRDDVAAALFAAACASTAVAPFLMCVDRAVVAAAAGTAPGGSLFRAIASVGSEFVTKPKTAFAQPALWMVAGVYAGTYFAKNVSDVVIERRGYPETHAGANAGKFAATTACNMGGSILKDAAFARLYGASLATVLVVPPASYVLFAARDCLTIGGAFVVPDALASLVTRHTKIDQNAAATLSQLVSPPLMQVICTPMHLWSLGLINSPEASVASRIARLRLATPAALLARSLRMLPAYGLGGILNSTLVNKGRVLAKKKGQGTSAKSASSKTDLTSSRTDIASQTLPGGSKFGQGVFGGNTGGGLEGFAVGFGLRNARWFGRGKQNGTTDKPKPGRGKNETSDRSSVNRGSEAGPVLQGRSRAKNGRFASVTMGGSPLGAGKAGDAGADFDTDTNFGARGKARFAKNTAKAGKGKPGPRFGRAYVWRPGRTADVAVATR
tara:strand:+ start:356 stop:1729 length:1374 start_codon:yes stop_codon:yes gene_type:complete